VHQFEEGLGFGVWGLGFWVKVLRFEVFGVLVFGFWLLVSVFGGLGVWGFGIVPFASNLNKGEDDFSCGLKGNQTQCCR
jgi:hypothetical protein